MDKIRSWPRWIQGGLLSVVAAGILYLVGFLIEPLSFISFGVVAPSVIIWSLPPALSDSIILSFTIHLGYWFLIGAFLGRFIKKEVWAALIWLVVQIFGGILSIFIAY